MTENEPSVTRCMIKRSKFVLKTSWIMCKIISIYLLFMVFVILVGTNVNVEILMYCARLVNVENMIVPSWIISLSAIIVFFVSVCEVALVCACLSCFPKIQAFGKKLFEWTEFDTLIKSKKKEEPLITEI